jgi:hypothetical protein
MNSGRGCTEGSRRTIFSHFFVLSLDIRGLRVYTFNRNDVGDYLRSLLSWFKNIKVLNI